MFQSIKHIIDYLLRELPTPPTQLTTHRFYNLHQMHLINIWLANPDLPRARHHWSSTHSLHIKEQPNTLHHVARGEQGQLPPVLQGDQVEQALDRGGRPEGQQVVDEVVVVAAIEFVEGEGGLGGGRKGGGGGGGHYLFNSELN